MELLQQIERTFRKLQNPSIEQLKEALLSLGPLLEQVPHYRSEPDGLAYGRNVLLRTEELEIVLIHIPPYRETAIHDHGLSIGAAFLAEGTLLNTVYCLDEHGYPVACEGEGGFIPAGALFEAPPQQIHQLSAIGGERAVSLHVYSPPLSGATRYTPYTEILDYVI